jgi:hypothetical protein
VPIASSSKPPPKPEPGPGLEPQPEQSGVGAAIQRGTPGLVLEVAAGERDLEVEARRRALVRRQRTGEKERAVVDVGQHRRRLRVRRGDERQRDGRRTPRSREPHRPTASTTPLLSATPSGAPASASAARATSVKPSSARAFGTGTAGTDHDPVAIGRQIPRHARPGGVEPERAARRHDERRSHRQAEHRIAAAQFGAGRGRVGVEGHEVAERRERGRIRRCRAGLEVGQSERAGRRAVAPPWLDAG